VLDVFEALQLAFRKVKGVVDTAMGFMGGKIKIHLIR